MPELPEVETIARRLAPYAIGKTFTNVTLYHHKSFVTDPQQLIGRSITAVSRRSKILICTLCDHSHLITHLKMTGQLIYIDPTARVGGGHPTQDWITQLPSKHTRIEYTFQDNSRLFFNDQRLFGWMKVVSDTQLSTLLSSLGPDANSPDFVESVFAKKLTTRRVSVKQVIMDNAVVAGVGNIYACDALHLAGISPFRPANSLSEQEVSELYTSIRTIIARGIELGGTTTDGKYVDVHGFAGGYQQHLRAYARQGERCRVCGDVIKKTTLAGRGTYWCPKCQK